MKNIPIVLLTDFGLKDPFVACMKGVVLSMHPEAQLIDLTHAITPYNIEEAARVLQDAYQYFPKPSLFVCVVDPGVGTNRKIVLLQTEDYYFLAPDNGLLGNILAGETAVSIHTVENPDFFKPENISTTFHGRDIFAPAAAHLALGIKPHQLGNPIKTLHRLNPLEPVFDENFVTAHILGFDHFGNAVTNYRCADIKGKRKIEFIKINRKQIPFKTSAYAKNRDKLFAHFNSFNRLEISYGNGSAEKETALKSGQEIKIYYEA